MAIVVATLWTEALAAPVDDGAVLYEAGRRAEFGEGVPPDLSRAQAFYCRAARQGHAEAAYRLGRFYWTGLGVRVDPNRALAWLAVAAVAGHRDARRTLDLLPRGKPTAQRPDCQPTPPRPASLPDATQLRALATGGAIADTVRALAPRFGLDPRLVLAVVTVESNFQPDAVSPKRAQGLMQLIPETAERFGVRDPFDPVENLTGGMKYLRWLIAYYGGDLRLALAGYNAGEGAVDRHGGVPPFAETQAYVRRIATLYPAERHVFDAAETPPSPILRGRYAAAR